MKWKRKMARKNLPKKYKCCGSEMLYKEMWENQEASKTERRCGMTELKPCPFCGGEAELNLLLGNYCVTCKSCMGAIFPAAGMTEEEAIELWNRRAGEKK